jgi:exo-beta-1,3-glucanase (GH17 family)
VAEMMMKMTTALLLGLLALSSTAVRAVEVTTSGRKILVDGSHYVIKGICYNPVPKGSDQRSFDTLTADLALMVEAGVNTIRVYTPIDDKAVLDEIHAAGLKVIMGFGYNQDGNYDIRSGTIIDFINTYKDHDAILMWELGNEYNYHPEWFEGDLKNWYEPMNHTAGLIHEQDTSHPVSTSHGELPDKLARSSCPNIDVWGMNVYRWDKPTPIFSEWKAVSSKPMYLSEAGADSYMTAAGKGYDQGINQEAQADATEDILKSIFRNLDICSGVTLYAFTDEWWKAGQPGSQNTGGSAPFSGGVPYDGAANEEHWGIVDIDRNKKMAFDIVKEKYNAPLKK